MSVEAEMSVLGAAVLDTECAMLAAEALAPEMFSHEHTRKIFEVISDMYWKGEHIDAVTITGKMPEEKVTIVKLAKYLPSLSHIRDYIRIVLDDWILSSLQTVLFECCQMNGDLTTVIAQAEEGLAEAKLLMDKRDDKDITSFKEASTEFRKWLKNWGKEETVKCGFPMLDNSTGGFLRGTVFVLAARPGGGKTDLAINLALRMIKRGSKVLYFSMEMTNLQIVQRVASSLLRINGIRVRDRSLTEEEIKQVDAVLENFESAGLLSFVEEPRVSVRRVRQLVELWKPDVVFIDHIGLMERPNIKEQYKAIGMVSNQLKQLALEKKISLIELVQMNRQIEGRKNKRPNLGDLRESGDIEQDADYVGFLVPEDLKDRSLSGDDYADTTLYLEKNRHGQPGLFRYHWQPQYHKFLEVENRYG